MSDADYEAFLNKANENVGGTSTQSKSKAIGIKSVNTKVPKSLELVDEFYVSESDEPFEPVSLTFKGTELPSEAEITKLVGTSVTSISQKDFDPKGQYETVITAVQEAGDGKANFYKAELDHSRTQYLVLSIDTEHHRIVGLKALAIES